MRQFATLSFVIGLLLSGGCRSVVTRPVQGYWTVRVDGSVFAAYQALENACAAEGGNRLFASSGSNVAFGFKSAVLVCWLNRDVICLLVSCDTRQRTGDAELQRFVERLTARAARESKLSVLANRSSFVETRLFHDSAPRDFVKAVNPRMKEFGAYLQRVATIVDAEFDRVVSNTDVFPPIDSWVAVSFLLMPDGRVGQITDIDNHSTAEGAKLVLLSLTNRAPYEAWTPEMKKVLSSEGEELRFTFYYAGQ